MDQKKNKFFIAGKFFDSFEDGLKYEKEWLESIIDEESFEMLWKNLGKEICMNIFLLERQIQVKDLKLILEDIFSHFISRSQGYNYKRCNVVKEIMDDEKSESTIIFNAEANEWVMKLTPRGIFFNRDRYPNAMPDDFANAVIEILEKNFLVKFEKNDN